MRGTCQCASSAIWLWPSHLVRTNRCWVSFPAPPTICQQQHCCFKEPAPSGAAAAVTAAAGRYMKQVCIVDLCPDFPALIGAGLLVICIQACPATLTSTPSQSTCCCCMLDVNAEWNARPCRFCGYFSNIPSNGFVGRWGSNGFLATQAPHLPHSLLAHSHTLCHPASLLHTPVSKTR